MRELGWFAGAIAIAVVVALGLFLLQEWHPGSPLDNRPYCAGLRQSSDCYGNPWP